MRYFFFFASAGSSLASSVGVPTTACRAVNGTCSAHAVTASTRGALTGAVPVSPITTAADKHLATATGTQVVSGTDRHRSVQADEGWIKPICSATLNRLCESTVCGMASVLTTKSMPTLCPSHQLPPHTAIVVACHPFARPRNVIRCSEFQATKSPTSKDSDPALHSIAANNRASTPAHTTRSAATQLCQKIGQKSAFGRRAVELHQKLTQVLHLKVTLLSCTQKWSNCSTDLHLALTHLFRDKGIHPAAFSWIRWINFQCNCRIKSACKSTNTFLTHTK
jgi:hypothetical protein